MSIVYPISLESFFLILYILIQGESVITITWNIFEAKNKGHLQIFEAALLKKKKRYHYKTFSNFLKILF